jgi:thymidylate synthase (FAD)
MDNVLYKLFIQDGVGFVELLSCSDNDLTVVNAARVSVNKTSNYVDDRIRSEDIRLIRYLAEHNHISPFFHPQIRFRIKMPIFIARQWYRSTVGFARNEVSRRYVNYTPEVFIPSHLRQASVSVKQGSSKEYCENEEDLLGLMQRQIQNSIGTYEELIKEGVCSEQARMVLPQNMYTEFIETGSLAAYARIYNLRKDEGAQAEIREYANLMHRHMRRLFPISWAALCVEPEIKND